MLTRKPKQRESSSTNAEALFAALTSVDAGDRLLHKVLGPAAASTWRGAEARQAPPQPQLLMSRRVCSGIEHFSPAAQHGLPPTWPRTCPVFSARVPPPADLVAHSPPSHPVPATTLAVASIHSPPSSPYSSPPSSPSLSPYRIASPCTPPGYTSSPVAQASAAHVSTAHTSEAIATAPAVDAPLDVALAGARVAREDGVRAMAETERECGVGLLDPIPACWLPLLARLCCSHGAPNPPTPLQARSPVRTGVGMTRRAPLAPCSPAPPTLSCACATSASSSRQASLSTARLRYAPSVDPVAPTLATTPHRLHGFTAPQPLAPPQARRAQAALSGLHSSGAQALGTLSTERACLLTELEDAEGVVATHAAADRHDEMEVARARHELNLPDERPSITSLLGQLRKERATKAEAIRCMQEEMSRSYRSAEEAEERARTHVKAADAERAAVEEEVHRVLCSHREEMSELMVERAAEVTALRIRCGELEQTVQALHRHSMSTEESCARSERAHRETKVELAAQGSLREQAQDNLREEKARGERRLARELGRTQRETDELHRRLERMQHLEERALGCRTEEQPAPVCQFAAVKHARRSDAASTLTGRAGEGGTPPVSSSELRANASRQQQQPWAGARQPRAPSLGSSSVHDDIASFTQLTQMKPARRALYWETLRTRLKRQLAEREEMARVADWQSQVVAEARDEQGRLMLG